VVANVKCLDRRRRDFDFRLGHQLRDRRQLRDLRALDGVHRRVRGAGVFVHGVDGRLLFVADRFNLTENNPEAAAQLLHVSQLVVLHLLLEPLLLHDDVDELLLAVDADTQLRVNAVLAAQFLLSPVAQDSGGDVKDGAVDLLRVLADVALCQVVRVQPHQAVVGAVLSETLDAELKLRQALIFCRKFGTR